MGTPQGSSQLEDMLELASLSHIGPDLFTNAREVWRPPGGRGIFGGVTVAQALSAAQKTVQDNFSIHSMHCYFLLVGDHKSPVTFTVQRVRDGKSFVTRTVLGSQYGKSIFTSTMSFMRHGSGGEQLVNHAPQMPMGLKPPVESVCGFETQSPYAPHVVPIGIEQCSDGPHDKRLRLWVRAPSKVVQAHNHNTHQMILAFISDWNFISAVPVVQNLWKFPEALSSNASVSPLDGTAVGMLSSLDHTIFFHAPLAIQADSWMLLEVESPWSGDERGIATSKIFSSQGTLLATCIQEGVLRLRKDSIHRGFNM